MLTSRAAVAALALVILAGAAPVVAQNLDTDDFRFWDPPGNQDWVDPEIAWRPEAPFWEGRDGRHDDLILDWPGGRHPWPRPEPASRGRLEAVVSETTAQVYRQRGRAAIQVDSRRVLRDAQEKVLRRDGGFRRNEFGTERVSFLVLIPLSEAVFFRGRRRWQERGQGHHGTGNGDGYPRGSDEYLVAAVQGSKDQIYYALPVQPYREDDYSRYSGTSTGNGASHDRRYAPSIWNPGPGHQPQGSWNFDMAVLGVAHSTRGGLEVVLGMDWTGARENRGYLDVGELPRLDSGRGRGQGRDDRRYIRPPLLGWTQDAQGGWLRSLDLEESWQRGRSFTAKDVGGMAMSGGGLSRSVAFWRSREGDGESVSAAVLVQDLRIQEDRWDRAHRPRHQFQYQQEEVYWGILWQWSRGHHQDQPVYRPHDQGGPDYDDLLR